MNLELGPMSSRGSNHSDLHKNQLAFVRFLTLHVLIPSQSNIKQEKLLAQVVSYCQCGSHFVHRLCRPSPLYQHLEGLIFIISLWSIYQFLPTSIRNFSFNCYQRQQTVSLALQTPCQQALTSGTCPKKIRCTDDDVYVIKILTPQLPLSI